MKSNFKYLIGFIAGLIVALMILVKVTPNALATMEGTIVAQGGEFSDTSLRALATCLSNSGFVAAQDRTPRPIQTYPNPDSNTNYIDATVIAKNDCLHLRQEGAIESVLRCMRSGEVVQVILQNREPIRRKYGGDDFVFVVAYEGGKGWAAREYLRY